MKMTNSVSFVTCTVINTKDDYSLANEIRTQNHIPTNPQFPTIPSGAACILCHIVTQSPSHYRINLSNVGHSEAVLCRRGRPLVLTHKHTLSGEQPRASEEYERVRDAGGIVTQVGGL
jgi:serine/threonine protein phosphatase PrpC